MFHLSTGNFIKKSLHVISIVQFPKNAQSARQTKQHNFILKYSQSPHFSHNSDKEARSWQTPTAKTKGDTDTSPARVTSRVNSRSLDIWVTCLVVRIVALEWSLLNHWSRHLSRASTLAVWAAHDRSVFAQLTGHCSAAPRWHTSMVLR